MINKIMKKVSILSIALLVSVSVVGCGEIKVGGEKLPISGIKEFESYRNLNSDKKCVGCKKKDVYYKTSIGNMCKKCDKRYQKYLAKLAKCTQTCGKCNNRGDVVVEYDRYNNPTEVACNNCVVIYENEAIEKMMNETIEKADLDREHKNIAKSQAKKDRKLITGATSDERSEQARMLSSKFASNVVSRYALSRTEQEAMIYIYMLELSK